MLVDSWRPDLNGTCIKTNVEAVKIQTAHYMDLMDCRTLFQADSSTSTGQKAPAGWSVYGCNEAKRGHRGPHYIISLRAETSDSVGMKGDRRILAAIKRQKRVTALFQQQPPESLFRSKAQTNATAGERSVSVCAILAHYFLCCSLRARQANMARGVTSDSSLETRWREEWQRREAELRHSAVSKSICISGADCEAPAGAV